MTNKEKNEALITEIADVIKRDRNVRVLCDLSQLTTRQLVRLFWDSYMSDPKASMKGFADALYAWVDSELEREQECD